MTSAPSDSCLLFRLASRWPGVLPAGALAELRLFAVIMTIKDLLRELSKCQASCANHIIHVGPAISSQGPHPRRGACGSLQEESKCLARDSALITRAGVAADKVGGSDEFAACEELQSLARLES